VPAISRACRRRHRSRRPRLRSPPRRGRGRPPPRRGRRSPEPRSRRSPKGRRWRGWRAARAGRPGRRRRPQLEESGAPVELRGPKPPTIVRLLQRDGATMSRLVDWLAGPMPSSGVAGSSASPTSWTRSRDRHRNGCFIFAAGNPFWDQLTVEEAREVARGLAALGFRYDGMGEFADGRVPGQHELSMALGQAGLLTVRVRHWPRPEEVARLYRYVGWTRSRSWPRRRPRSRWASWSSCLGVARR